MPSVFTLKLQDDIDSIDFIGGAQTYQLLDGTFEMPVPESVVKDREFVDKSRKRMQSRYYTQREITFEFRVKSTSQQGLVDAVNVIYRMLSRASSPRYINGGVYSDTIGYNSSDADAIGTVTGDQGLILVVKMTDGADVAITNEVDEAAYDYREYTANVISAEMEVLLPLSVEGYATSGATYYYNRVAITLVCKPALSAVPRRVASVATNLTALPYPYGSGGNRLIIPAASVPGTEEALTRITTAISNGYGVIIAREAGKSLLNCPTPAYKISPSGTSNADPVAYMFSYGYGEQATSNVAATNIYDVKIITTSPFVIQWKKNGGSYSANVTVTPYTNIVFESGTGYEFGVVFTDTVGSVDDVYRIHNNQSFIYPNASFNANADIATYMDSFGKLLGKFNVNIQRGVYGKYKVLAHISGPNTNHEVRLSVKSFTHNGYSSPSYSGWIAHPVGGNAALIDMGTIDLSPQSRKAGLRPISDQVLACAVYARGLQAPTGTHTISIGSVFLVPCEDENSMLRVGWIFDGPGFEEFCNYDKERPYIVEVNAGYTPPTYSVSDHTTVFQLDETHDGNVITLIPGLTNTIMFVPIVGATGDYRNYYWSNTGDTGPVTVSIKPQSMFVG